MKRRLLVDLRPLRDSPAFRGLWIGSMLSSIGGQMTTFAVALQVFTLTRSSFAVGVVGLFSSVPAIVFGLLGGSLVDAIDRRRLVLATTAALTAISAVLAAQAYAGWDRVWPLYLLVGAASVLTSITMPARKTFLPRLLPAEQIPAGTALNMMTFHGAMTIGPAVAGLVAGAWGLRTCYLLDAISFVAALASVFRLPPMPPDGGGTRPSLRSLGEGLRFIGRSRILVGAFLSDVNATLLGMPFALFPAINADRFGGSPRTLGLLTTAVAVGGVIGSMFSGPLGHVTRQGRTMLLAGAVWGVALAGFGLARSLWVALLLLAVAGTADVISVIARSTIVTLVTPDRYRGRVGSADFVIGGAFPQLGNFRAGVVASMTSPGASAFGGGLAVVAGTALIRLLLPALARYDSAAPEPADAAAGIEALEPAG